MAATLHGIQLFPSRLKNIEGNKWQTIIPAARLSSKIILFRVTWITASHDRVAENDVSLQRILIVSIFFLSGHDSTGAAGRIITAEILKRGRREWLHADQPR
jgi:hypothetical protein